MSNKSIIKSFLKQIILDVIPIFFQALKDLWDEIVEQEELKKEAEEILKKQEKELKGVNN